MPQRPIGLHGDAVDGFKVQTWARQMRGLVCSTLTLLASLCSCSFAGLHSAASSSLRAFANAQDLLAEQGPAYDINLRVFYDLQRTITGWPGEVVACLRGALRRAAGRVLRRGMERCRCRSKLLLLGHRL